MIGTYTVTSTSEVLPAFYRPSYYKQPKKQFYGEKIPTAYTVKYKNHHRRVYQYLGRKTEYFYFLDNGIGLVVTA